MEQDYLLSSLGLNYVFKFLNGVLKLNALKHSMSNRGVDSSQTQALNGDGDSNIFIFT